MSIELYNDDCLKILPTIKDKSIDLVLTDPPYGINYQSNMRVQTEKFKVLDNDNNDFRFSTYPLIYQKLKDNSVCIVFCSFKNYAFDYLELSKLFDIKNCIIWDKRGGGIGDLVHSLSTDYKMALICHKGNCPIKGKREGSVWNCGKVTPSLMKHPTQKPEGICNKLITKFSDNNAIVLDPFMGSGTTGVAAKELGRSFIGIEISPEYFKIAEKRIMINYFSKEN